MRHAIPFFFALLLFTAVAGAQDSAVTGPSLFQQAESLFHDGKDDDARLLYEKYLSQYPGEEYAGKAMFRVGEVDFRKNSYPSAVRSFQYFLESFPGSTLGYHANLKIAQCYFWMQKFDEAEPLFRDTIQANPDLSQKWQAYTYLGLIAEKRADYPAAIEHLREVYLKNEDTDLRRFVVQEMNRIVNEKMDIDGLVRLVRNLRQVYPAELALQRLIEEYRNVRDMGNYQASLEDFIERFPEHPLRPVYIKAVDAVRADRKHVRKLAAVLPLSGRRALVGQQVLQGIQLAFNQLTALERSQIELVVRDSGLQRSTDKVVEELAGDPNVVGILGPVLSEDLQGVAPILDRYRLPAFSPTASASGLGGLSPFIFRNALTKEVQATFLARHAINNLNHHRFMVIYPEDSYGITMKTVFEKEIRSLGGHIVDSLSFTQDQNDFRELIFKIGGLSDDRLKARIRWYMEKGIQPPPLNDKGNVSRPLIDGGLFTDDDVEGLTVSMELNYDAIFIPGYYDKVGLLVPQLVFYNIDNVLLMGGNGWNSQELVDHARNYLKSVLFVDGFFVDSEDPLVKAFVQNYRSSFGEDPTVISAQSYDTAHIMIRLAMEGAQNRKEMKDRLAGVRSFPGVTGAIDILANGETEKQLVRLTVDQGMIVPVPDLTVEPEPEIPEPELQEPEVKEKP